MVVRKKISIENLMLDPKNYRHAPQDGQPQAIRAVIEEQGRRLVTLAEDIIKYGLSPIELFMAAPFEGSAKRYVVIEGNRRTTAIKLVLNPDLAKNTDLEKAFRRLHAKHENDVPKSISDVVIVPSKKDGIIWARRRHDRGLQGAGLEDWTSTAKDRADAAEGKSSITLDAREFVAENADLTDEIRTQVLSNKFNSTNLSRLLGTAYIRKALGLQPEGTHFTSDAAPEWVLKILTEMVVAVATEKHNGKPFNVPNIRDVAQREAFMKQLEGKHPKPAGVQESWPVTGKEKVTPSRAAAAPAKRSATLTVGTPDRNRLIPKGFKITLPPGKITNVFNELRTLDIEKDKFINSAAILLRVFLEFSADHYIKTREIELPVGERKVKSKCPSCEHVWQTTSTHTKERLHDKLLAIAEYMRANSIMDKKELKPLRDALSDPSSPVSTETLNSYVHHPVYSPKSLPLKTDWDHLQPFVEKIWQATSAS